MDPALLAQHLTTLLTPFLPYLLQVGQVAAQEAGKKFGNAAWETARGLWQSLAPKIESQPAAKEATAGLAKQPDNQDTQAAFREQLRKLLAEDEAFANEIASRMSAVTAQQVDDSNIETGNHNVVQRGKYNVSIDKATGVVIGDQARPISDPEKNDAK